MTAQEDKEEIMGMLWFLTGRYFNNGGSTMLTDTQQVKFNALGRTWILSLEEASK